MMKQGLMQPELQLIASYEDGDPRLHEPEETALSRVLHALEEAIDHPGISIDWRVSFQSAHSALLDYLEPPALEPSARGRLGLELV
jgi:hypothetical protein